MGRYRKPIGLTGLKFLAILTVAFPGGLGCSDFGTAPWAGWTEYDLPYAQIYLPASLERQQTVAVGPQNPAWAGVVDNKRLVVEFCLYTQPIPAQWLDYEEEAISLCGRPTVIFHGTGLLHAYDSSFQPLIGIRAYFNPNGDSVVVIIKVEDESGYEVARKILMSVHPQPANTGGLV
jgi:hypothetical protein